MIIELDRWGNDVTCNHPDTGCGCEWNEEAVITLDHDDAWALLQFLVGDCDTIDVETAKHLLAKLGELFDE